MFQINGNYCSANKVSKASAAGRGCFVPTLKELNGFRFIDKNREITPKHVNDIFKVMQQGLEVGVVEVESNTNYILEGQHRVEAAKKTYETESPFPLKVAYLDFGGNKADMLAYVQRRNSTIKKWTDKDYVDFYKESGNDYERLEKWALSHKLTRSKKGRPHFQYAITFILGKNYSSALLKKGLFNPTEQDWERAETLYREVEYMLKESALAASTTSTWFNAFIKGWDRFSGAPETLEKINTLENGMDTYLKAFVNYLKGTIVHTTTNPAEWENIFNSALTFEALAKNKYLKTEKGA